MKSVFCSLAIAGVLFFSAAANANAQATLDDIEAALGGMSDEMTRVDALLADPDQNKRLAAMKMLIQSGNPLYMQRARETGLFSSDKEMQRVALAAIFDGGGPFRVDVPLQGVDEDATRARDWLRGSEGSEYNDGKMGQWTFFTKSYDDEKRCWPHDRNDNYCAFLATGDYYIVDWFGVKGTVKLSPDGMLLGEGRYGGNETFKFQINLVE